MFENYNKRYFVFYMKQMVMNGVITFYLTAKKMRYNNWLVSIALSLKVSPPHSDYN